MRVTRLVDVFIVSLVLIPAALSAQGLVNPATEKKIDALLAQMTLEEKVGQLNQYSSPFDVTGPPPERGRAEGGVRPDPHRARRLDAERDRRRGDAQGAAARGREQPAEDPADLRLDVIHGYRTIFPIPLGEAASWDPAAVEQSARVGGDRGGRGGPALDVRADGRHRARRALGPDHGRLRRGPVPRRADGGRARARLPGHGPGRRRHDRGLREALRGLRLRRGRPRLQHRRHLGAARCATSCCRRSRPRPTPASRRS